MQGTSGLAHVSLVQADATVATTHSSGQPKPQGSIAPHSVSGDIQGLAQPCATAASVKHSGWLRNSNLSGGYSTDVTTYAPLPSFLKSICKPRISTHSERRHGLPSLTYRSSSGSSSISSINSMGSEDDKKAGIERCDKDNQQRSMTIQARRHSSEKAAKQCAKSRGDHCKSQRSLSRHQISNDPSSGPSSSDSGSSSSSSSGGDCKRAKNKTKRYERKPHKTRSAPVKTTVYKRKQCSSSSSESSEASEVEQVMTTRVSDIQLRDFNPQGREEWLTRATNYLKSYPDISEATRVNLYKKLPTEDRILLDMMRGTATLKKAEEVLRKKYASSQMSDVQVALSGMHLASNELPSEMLRKTLQKAHLSVPIMNKVLDMLVKVLFLQALPPEARLKFSGYWGTTQQLMNEADSYVITLRQENCETRQ